MSEGPYFLFILAFKKKRLVNPDVQSPLANLRTLGTQQKCVTKQENVTKQEVANIPTLLAVFL